MKKITWLLVILLFICITVLFPVSAEEQSFTDNYNDKIGSETYYLKVSGSDKIVDDKFELYNTIADDYSLNDLSNETDENSTVNKEIIEKDNLSESQKKLSTNLLSLTNSEDQIYTLSDDDLIAGMVELDQLIVSGQDSGEDLVYVYIYLFPEYSTSVIKPYVSEVKESDEKYHYVAAYVKINDLLKVASLSSVKSIYEVSPPVTNSGSVESEGDLILKTKELRQETGFTGKDIKIGIISNGVDHIYDSQATGDLPANVHVLNNRVGGDEGTAMLEIVYDMAPGAELYFHDCGSNTIEFNKAIDALVSSGCNIICDDISWITQPFFEDGSIALHVEDVLDNNDILYISSAGNYGGRHYQGLFYDQGNNLHDFSSGTSSNKYLYQRISGYSSLRVVLEWNDDFSGSSNDYDLWLYNSNTGDLLAKSTNTQSGTQKPLEYISYTNPGYSSLDTTVVVSKYSGSKKILELYVYGTSYSDNIVASDSIFGHPAIDGAIAAGAIAASDPGNNNIESFSSRGPVTIYYPSYEQRDKPDIAGIDGVSVTGAGGFSNPFYGTSASAPGIAGLLALIMDACPDKTPDEIKAALYSTADDLGSSGFDYEFGYGRADAVCLFDSLNTIPVAEFSADATSGTAPLSVQFSDESTGDPTSWLWNFGDGDTSAEQNPEHIFTETGTYDISLTAANADGSDTTTKTNYITVLESEHNNIIKTGDTVFIGESGLDVSSALGDQTDYISYYYAGATPGVSSPSDIVNIANPSEFYVSPDLFTGKTGLWYRGLTDDPMFYVEKSSLSLSVFNYETRREFSNDMAYSGYEVAIRINSNLYSLYNRNPSAICEGIDVYVVTPDGATLTKLMQNSSKAEVQGLVSLSDIKPTSMLYYIPDGLMEKIWTFDENNYKKGYYRIYAECNENGMKDNLGTVTGVTKSETEVLYFATDDVCISADKESVTRNNDFAVIIDGKSESDYIVWISGTESYSNTSDCPPKFMSYQDGVNYLGQSEADSLFYEPGKSIGNNIPCAKDGSDNEWAVMAETGVSGTNTIVITTDVETKDTCYTIRVQGYDKSEGVLTDTYDTVNVCIEKGHVTLTASGDGSYYASEEVTLSGMDTDSNYIYLFMTGSGLPENGGLLTSPYTPVNTDPLSQDNTCVSVLVDSTWDYKWDTSEIMNIPAGTYTIYAASKNVDKSGLGKSVYDSVSIVIKKPFVSLNAEFTADKTEGTAPLTVQFGDESTGDPTSWLWNFGDGDTSAEQNPEHTYVSSGYYDVMLTVADGEYSDTATKTDYIRVNAQPTHELPEHSLYIGNSAVSIGYLMNHPVEAQQMVNQLIGEQGLSLTDLWYRINDGDILNILTGMPAGEEELTEIRATLVIYIDENGEAHEIQSQQYATGKIVVGAMNFNDLYVDEVAEIPGATHFTIEGGSVQKIGENIPVTFMGVGSVTLQITDNIGNVLANGNIVIPGEQGEHTFTINLVEASPAAEGVITVGAMNFNDLIISAVSGVPGAVQFSITEVETFRLIGGEDPVTFMGAGSTTLQIYDGIGTEIATGILEIPSSFGEHNLIVNLEII